MQSSRTRSPAPRILHCARGRPSRAAGSHIAREIQAEIVPPITSGPRAPNPLEYHMCLPPDESLHNSIAMSILVSYSTLKAGGYAGDTCLRGSFKGLATTVA